MAPVPYVFIGDDFTGASDTLATLSERRWRTQLYLRTPAADTVSSENLDALGIATDLRALPPEVIIRHIDMLAPQVAAFRPRIVHYKVCSTFDSAVHTGNIGAAVGALERHLQPAVTAIIGGQPSLGRYCSFGTLFARGGDGETYRIDRHPVMKRHPITPMTEADLRLHLGGQGLDGLQLVGLTELAKGEKALASLLREAVQPGQKRFLFDATDQHHLEIIGRVLTEIATGSGDPLLLVGASSVAEALVTARPIPRESMQAAPADHPGAPCLIVAGSRSSVTAEQVATAVSFRKRAVTAKDLEDETLFAALVEECCESIREGRHMLAHLLPEEEYGLSAKDLSSHLAELVSRVLARVPLQVLGIAGGDTSSIIAQNIGLESLEFEKRLGKGVAVCRARSRIAHRDGLRVMFKGGQVGAPDVFDAFVLGS
ncbi:four-carbon acid sugar kinase family protein [uncultured Roseibium sp.]|uniref:four-carbon acid sugar kinase family protein n=1 Tax=uncultured Roseibium sp. TaxID=1936171 RepID=UPI002633ED92|nr:four-carbon acid sugar kinase family protein [uncultured Roseibium sp.]